MGREGKGKEISPSVQPATCLKFHCARKSNVVCIFTRSTGAPSRHGSYEIWLWYTLMSDQVSFGCPYDLMSIVLPCRVGQTLTGLPVSASSVNALSSTRDGGDSAHATDGHRESLPPFATIYTTILHSMPVGQVRYRNPFLAGIEVSQL